MAPAAEDTVVSVLPDTAAASAITSFALHITIIGAGIGGLTAAIGLRRAGHKVTIFERSSFGHEIGAAIHVCPNASRVLLPWGFDPKSSRQVVCRSSLLAHADTLETTSFLEFPDIESRYSAPWFLSHRVDLHNELRRLATQDEGPGEAVKIQLSAEVTGIDPGLGTVSFKDGSSYTSDLVVGADGVHSLAASVVSGRGTPATATGFSAFRFLIPSEEILADEQTRSFIDGKDGQANIFLGEKETRLVFYPCRNGQVQNFALVHSDNDKRATQEGWNISANVSDLLDECKQFHPRLLALCRKAHDLKLWKLLYRAPISTWYKQRLVLIGDAAHPMLPHQGQGGAQSIEDGAALGILFSRLPPFTTAKHLEETIAARLQGFESVRHNRASVMQIYSNAGQDESEKIRDEAMKYLPDGVQVPTTKAEFHEFNFGYDVVKDSQRVLSELV